MGHRRTGRRRGMTRPAAPGIDTAPSDRHSFRHMLRTAAYFYFGYFGFFAPKTMGGCLDA